MKLALNICYITCLITSIGFTAVGSKLHQIKQNQEDDHYQMERNCWAIAGIEKKVNRWKREFYLKEEK